MQRPAGIGSTDFAVTGGTCGGRLSGGGASCTYLLKFTPSLASAGTALAHTPKNSSN